MGDRLLPPIMIGITGKRDLLGKDAEVADTLRAGFDLLDQNLPASPKTLLTGLAKGADTVAARLALDRGWKVVAVLPFALDLFLQDFEPADAEELRKFADPKDGLLTDPAKGRVIVLDPLLDPQGRPLTDAALGRGATSNAARSEHYEQVGLFIADRSALLIGVMPADEKPDRTGGTARIVEYRLRGAFDETSARILERSQVLSPPVPLDAPQFHPVWLVDLASVGGADGALRPIQVWSRGSRHAGADADESKIEIEKVRWRGPGDLMRPLRLAARIDAFNALATEADQEHRKKEVADRARRDAQWQGDLRDRALADKGDASAMLKQVRSDLSIIQGWAKRRRTTTVKSLAVLFVLTVSALEIMHLEVYPFTVPLLNVPFEWAALYILLSIAILGVLFYARLKKLSQFTEDYRAAAEALRVQLVWWDAGLVSAKHRVDRTYLCGAGGTLGLVRAAIGYLIGAALTERAPPPKSLEAVTKWIAGQVDFFQARTEARKSFLASIDELIWFLFIGSIGMGACLIALRAWPRDIEHVYAALSANGLRVAPWIALLLTFALYRLSGRMSRLPKHGGYGWRRLPIETLNFLVAVLAGLSFAAFVYGLLRSPFADVLRHVMDVRGCEEVHGQSQTGNECATDVTYRLLATLTGVVAAVSGALRFYSERMAFEAELHSYREALATFTRAQGEISRLGPDLAGPAKERFDEIVTELGKFALEENESWIRAHRVRQLEPHV